MLAGNIGTLARTDVSPLANNSMFWKGATGNSNSQLPDHPRYGITSACLMVSHPLAMGTIHDLQGRASFRGERWSKEARRNRAYAFALVTFPFGAGTSFGFFTEGAEMALADLVQPGGTSQQHTSITKAHTIIDVPFQAWAGSIIHCFLQGLFLIRNLRNPVHFTIFCWYLCMV